MIRIEILFDRQSTKNLKSGTLQALQNEIEQRLKPHYPEIWLHMWEIPVLQSRELSTSTPLTQMTGNAEI
ncbi:hypothetical protein AB2E98_25595 (plasmid) [Escherichia coli]